MRCTKILGLAFVWLSFLPSALSARQDATVTVAWVTSDRDDWGRYRNRDDYYRRRHDCDDRRYWKRCRRDRDDYRSYRYGDRDGYRR
ncbi:MAG TPA: hypothetical protein VI455_09350 [Terriglobia bacterium]